MSNKLWQQVILAFAIVYGPFLIIQAFIDVWPTKQMHSFALFIGGVALSLWAVRYWLKGPKGLVYAINAFVITVLAVFSILVPVLVITTLVN